MDCLVLPVSLLRRRSMASRLGYQPLTEDKYGELDRRQVTVVVGKEKREFVVDPFVLEESPFRVLIDTMKKDYGSKIDTRWEKKRVIFVDVDAILFEHMLWLMNNDCSSLFQLNVKEIIDFYAQDY
ncbi:Auxin responsive SAUR protein [Corchorus capsularis]|uniref:Auxin responsive SAUR protein n=1 Tax=Corchorus capsularis TaxID=210143 RepID=A0A1R3I3T1_COCAP|nr:Auxin responsive SAUR protein [Corchorus capsularis]